MWFNQCLKQALNCLFHVDQRGKCEGVLHRGTRKKEGARKETRGWERPTIKRQNNMYIFGQIVYRLSHLFWLEIHTV